MNPHQLTFPFVALHQPQVLVHQVFLGQEVQDGTNRISRPPFSKNMGAQLSCQHCTVVIVQQNLDIPCVKHLQLQKHRFNGADDPQMRMGLDSVNARDRQGMGNFGEVRGCPVCPNAVRRFDEVFRTASHTAVLVPV